MNINIKPATTKRVYDLRTGDTFFYNYKYYIKTDEWFHFEDGTAACVELKSGIICRFTYEDVVVPISLTVIETPEPEG